MWIINRVPSRYDRNSKKAQAMRSYSHCVVSNLRLALVKERDRVLNRQSFR